MEYTESRHRKGYGEIYIDGKKYKAHRLAYLLCIADIPEGLLVCHKCDNPPCINPEHLFLDTDKDNSDDKIAKGRELFVKGSRIGTSKLKETDIAEIRKLLAENKLSSRQIGALFGVAGGTIRHIKAGSNWKHA